jgi:hypothetical protein
VDTNNYDLLLDLDFLIKIGVVVDVEKWIIQIRQGRGKNVQILSLNMVNMLQLVTNKNYDDDGENQGKTL